MGIEVGQVIDGKYRVTARIGEGGMGAVFAAEHLKLHRKVAIKTLHPSLADDPEVIRRFEREAQAAGRIGNDHILEVSDIGELPGGDRYMVMEFLEGEPLNDRLTRLTRMTPIQVYPLARQMLEGLAAAHAAGIVHRDLKPANIFILREKAGVADYVKLIDFGISKFKTLAGETNQTRTGTIIGTPSYMSPEQARGLREADARSDIYAVGVILYEAVTGRVPFVGASTNDLLFKIFLNEVPPIEELAKDTDPGFCSIVMKALSKEPTDRFVTAEEFVAALDAWAQTGRGVTLVKRAEPAHTVIEGPRAPRQSAGPPPAAPTQGSWAESRSQATGAPPSSSSSKAAAAILGIVVTLIGVGAAIVALRSVHATPPRTPVAASSAQPQPLPSPAASLATAVIPAPPLPAIAPAAVVDAGASSEAHPPPPPPRAPPARPNRGSPSPRPPAPKAVDPLEQL